MAYHAWYCEHPFKYPSEATILFVISSINDWDVFDRLRSDAMVDAGFYRSRLRLLVNRNRCETARVSNRGTIRMTNE